MKLIDVDKLIADLKNPDLCNVTPQVFKIIDEQPTYYSHKRSKLQQFKGIKIKHGYIRVEYKKRIPGNKFTTWY